MIVVADITYQLILFNSSLQHLYYMIPTILYIFIFLFIIFIKFIPEVYVPVRLSIHDNLCILYPAFSPFYLYRHAYLRVLWSALNATSELLVHVDG